MSFSEAATGSCTAGDDRNSDAFFPGRWNYEPAIRGMNEGFADLLAFSMTGTVNLFRSSDSHRQTRSLVSEETCAGSFYCIGTRFARAAYDAYRAEGFEVGDEPERHPLLRDYVEALRGTQARMRERGLTIAPSGTARECTIWEGARYDGQVLGAALDAFLAGLPDHRREALCPTLVEHLGDEYFPAAYRTECE